MSRAAVISGLERLTRFTWAFFFLALPVTSFPFLPDELGGKALVRPLAIYPLILLLVLITLPRLFKEPLPLTFLPLFGFILAAMISSIFAFTVDLEAYRGVSLAERFVRGLITLGLGVSFYLTVTLLPKSWADLRFSLRWLYGGMALALMWGSLQALYVIHYVPRYFKLLNLVQGYISTRKLFTTRISGLTYEPKWFAEQIIFLLLPWLLGSILTRRTIFPWRFRWLTVEWFLFAWACVVLVFTYSRTGLFVLAALVILAFGYYRASSHRKAIQSSATPRRWMRRWIELTALLALLVGGMFVVGSQNPYFSRLWRYWTENKARSRTYLEYIAFEQRFVYWATALRIYQQNPWVGVGLGNYAFYFAEMIPDQPYDQQREVMRQITPADGRDRLITPKNLYARLISETGLLGTATFTAFLLAVIGGLLYLWFSPSSEQKYWGVSGALALFVFAFVIFSFDSFALPNMWVVFGMITAAARLEDPPPAEGLSG